MRSCTLASTSHAFTTPTLSSAAYAVTATVLPPSRPPPEMTRYTLVIDNIVECAREEWCHGRLELCAARWLL
jgi:hypothetical protein